ncbi:GDSL-like Lipase/Acylhydrolase [Geosmithia morbida]|uniref:GDSL-like Lipase/Acylhydrolase n=1 Tax=Geosmithia morbida TaxID=1094350 RepID=A0A9P4YT89_9HYPO|nr:GDSL-like Lipase/Acylhydrolase [Geosmithia morbida]KAF4121241.1 GDSL-like Lipase/Acylhydrolase [Geosmithia morbida]
MAMMYPQLVLLGDSLFQNSIALQDGFSFNAAVQSLCTRKLDVINRGLSGWNTKNLIEYMDRIFPEPTANTPEIKYVAILMGANDAVLPFSPTKQHVPIDEYKENLIKIISHPRIKKNKPIILLVTPPPVDELKHSKLDAESGLSSSIRTSAVSASYAEKAREVARENPDRVVLVDLWQAIMDKAIAMSPDDYQPGGPWLGSPENGKAGGLDTLLPDGLHMNGEAYRIFFDIIRPHIGKEWEGLPPNAGYVFPSWQNMNRVEVVTEIPDN